MKDATQDIMAVLFWAASNLSEANMTGFVTRIPTPLLPSHGAAMRRSHNMAEHEYVPRYTIEIGK
jgi:hypothetical protein